MDGHTTTEQLLIHVEYIREGIDGVHARLDALNGRTRTNETDIAVLKDRSADARKAGGLWGAGAGAFVGGVLAVLYQTFGGSK